MDQEIRQLITIYQSAREKIIQSIVKTEAKGNNSDYKKALLNQVDGIIYGLNKDALNWTNDTLPRYYKQGIEETNKQLKKMGVIPSVNASFAKVHELAVETVVKNTSDKLIDANLFIGRQINDNIRQAGLEAVQEKFTTGLTVRETKDFLVNSLLESGLGGIKDKLGRVMQIESYAQMVARSTTRETTNRATINQMTALEYDLVQMSEHGSSCPLCAPLEGRIYSISGEDKRFPALDIAYDGDYANIHPNCAHVLTPYIEDFADNLKEDIANANRPFEIDERAKQQIDSYNKIQAVKTELRNDRKLYEKYKILLKDEAPKSFSGFRKIKKADGDKWNLLNKKYQEEKSRIDIKTGKYSLIVNKQKQNKHIDGTKEYIEHIGEKSILTSNAQELVNKHYGSGRIIIAGKNLPKEKFVNDNIIGRCYNKDIGEFVNTNCGFIIYSKTGTHVYPVLPDKK